VFKGRNLVAVDVAWHVPSLKDPGNMHSLISGYYAASNIAGFWKGGSGRWSYALAVVETSNCVGGAMKPD
jgi:hypothetical protein